MRFEDRFELAKALAKELEAAWGKNYSLQREPLLFRSRRRKLAPLYGPARANFQVRVQENEVVVHCLTPVAGRWGVLEMMERNGIPCRNKDWEEVTYYFKVKR